MTAVKLCTNEIYLSAKIGVKETVSAAECGPGHKLGSPFITFQRILNLFGTINNLNRIQP